MLFSVGYPALRNPITLSLHAFLLTYSIILFNRPFGSNEASKCSRVGLMEFGADYLILSRSVSDFLSFSPSLPLQAVVLVI